MQFTKSLMQKDFMVMQDSLAWRLQSVHEYMQHFRLGIAS